MAASPSHRGQRIVLWPSMEAVFLMLRKICFKRRRFCLTVRGYGANVDMAQEFRKASVSGPAR